MPECDSQFDGRWNVYYTDEPEYSGEMVIVFGSDGISVNGTIFRYGQPDGSYVGRDFSCATASNEASFRYELASGHTGTMNLTLIVPSPNNILGYYIDDGNGDRGLVEITRITERRFHQRGPEGFFSDRDENAKKGDGKC